MRVVGGKTGADGRLFAYLVWTVPGGPAEKMGLQQGDKVSKIVKAKKKKLRSNHLEFMDWHSAAISARFFKLISFHLFCYRGRC